MCGRRVGFDTGSYLIYGVGLGLDNLFKFLRIEEKRRDDI